MCEPSIPHRCAWVPNNDPLYCRYHDLEWGVPKYEEHILFEMLVLETFQSGLSWRTVLHKREAIKSAFNHFDLNQLTRWSSVDIESRMNNPNIIRNKRKITSVIHNASAVLKLHQQNRTLSDLLWSTTNGKQKLNQWITEKEIPSMTPESIELSHQLKRYGFTLVGPVVCYSLMQSIGIVNDHVTRCFRHKYIANSNE